MESKTGSLLPIPTGMQKLAWEKEQIWRFITATLLPAPVASAAVNPLTRRGPQLCYSETLFSKDGMGHGRLVKLWGKQKHNTVASHGDLVNTTTFSAAQHSH